jgi:hypothetical protein
MWSVQHTHGVDFRSNRRKVVVLGPVSTRLLEFESPDDLRRRIDVTAAFMPLQRLALSPQCGFASVFAATRSKKTRSGASWSSGASVAKNVFGRMGGRAPAPDRPAALHNHV